MSLKKHLLLHLKREQAESGQGARMYEFCIVCVLTHYFSSSTRLSKMIHTKENNANTWTNTNYFLKVFHVSLCVCYTIYIYIYMYVDRHVYVFKCRSPDDTKCRCQLFAVFIGELTLAEPSQIRLHLLYLVHPLCFKWILGDLNFSSYGCCASTLST